MYPYKGIVEAVKNKKIQLRNMNTTEMLIRLSNIKDDIISNVGIINTNEKLND